MTHQTHTIAESNNFIVLDKYIKAEQTGDSYQSESDLERELIQDLRNQGYEFISVKSQLAMLSNVREQLQSLNGVVFNDSEWRRFTEQYLDNPSDGILDKTRKIHIDYICDFIFDDERLENIYLIDKKNLMRNKVQIIQQFEQAGSHANRYDVTILVNGLPLVQIELKKRGVAIREAFNQIHRYSKESFNSENSLFKYLQLFVISNGTDTRYFANTTKRDKNSFDFTMNWAKSDNTLIKDLKDFTATFFQKHTLLNVLVNYSVFDISQTLLVMRPYQIAATERILWKINSSYKAKNWSTPESGGFIWHTTGSGKTLTSFKAARLATELDFIDKVFFVVDRKDLDYRKAHHHLLSLYAEHELEHALNETCEALVRAMHLSILVQENPLANTTGHQGYIAPEKAVMQQVKSSLEQKIKQMQISLSGEPVLRLAGLSAATLPHMDYEVAGTPAQRKVWQDKIDQQGAELKARGLLS